MRGAVLYCIVLISGLLLLGCSGKQKAQEAQVRKIVSETENNLQALYNALLSYQADQGSYPERLAGLTTPVAYIDPMPVDMFNLESQPIGVQQNPYQYIKEDIGEGLTVIVYSFGPDGDNDAALEIYDPTNGTISNGDLITQVCFPPLTPQQVQERDRFRFEIEQIRKAPENNGIKEYMLAIKQANYDKHDYDLLDEIYSAVKAGLYGDLADLDSLIDKNQAVLNLIHYGGTKPIRRAIIDEGQIDVTSHTPEFTTLRHLSKLMICQGKQFETKGKHEQAIQNYVDVIKFGQCVGNVLRIAKYISAAIECAGYRALLHILYNFKFHSNYLKGLIVELEEIEKTSPPLVDALWHEHLLDVSLVKYGAETIKFKELFTPSADLPNNWYFKLNKNRIIRNSTEFWLEAIDNLKKPFPEAIKFDYQARVAKLDKFSRMFFPDILEAKNIDTFCKSYATATRIIAGLQLYKTQQGCWPDSLDQLSSILDKVPVDPFTTRDFRYEKVDDNFKLYSLGPDLKDDRAMIEYDPTNGTISPGDIIFPPNLP